MNLGEALQFLREYDREASFVCNRVMVAQWNFATNITDANRRKMVNIDIREYFVELKIDLINFAFVNLRSWRSKR